MALRENQPARERRRDGTRTRMMTLGMTGLAEPALARATVEAPVAVMSGFTPELAQEATKNGLWRPLRALGAVERTRTSTPFGRYHLKVVRLPVPPRPHCQLAPVANQ